MAASFFEKIFRKSKVKLVLYLLFLVIYFIYLRFFPSQPVTLPSKSPIDVSSLSNPHEVSISHMDLDLHIDFPTKSVRGYADLTLKIQDPDHSTKLVLDVTTLKIKSVTDLSDNQALKTSLAEPNKILGTAFTIELGKKYTESDKPKLRIAFETVPEATALQWLDPSQTLGKKHPYMFSQCEEIHARSLIPCQDTPAVKFTFTAKVSVPKPLRALIGGILIKEETDGELNVYHYEQKIPIPSYLFAIAGGDISYVDISPRIRAYSEEGYLERAKFEFEPAEKFIQVAEELLTPYEWTRYDLLILPPSFPFGGMENPCLTFLSPTIIAGDRSLINVMIHELTHSWIGNLVTNINWSHFWLNEGINVYHERRVAAAIYGEESLHLASLEGLKALESYVKIIGENHPFSVLITNLEGIDPDEAFSVLYYEKGYFLCLYLEQLLGLDFMKSFFKEYVKTFRLKSVTTDDFLTLLKAKVQEKFSVDGLEKLKQVDWDGWFHKPGIIPQLPKLDYTEYNVVKALATEYFNNLGSLEKLASHEELSSGNWHTIKVLIFFDIVGEMVKSEKKKIDESVFDWLDNKHKFSDRNAEIACKWFQLCITQGYTKVDAKIEAFLTTIGRVKFVKPLFKALVEAGRIDFAKRIYEKNKGSKHSLELKLIGDMLAVKS